MVIPNEVYNVLSEVWPMIFIFVFIVGIIRIFSLKSQGKQIVIYKEFVSLIFIIYLLMLFELVTNTDMKSIGNNFTPFKEMFRYKITSKLFLRNVIGNVVLFVPFGFFICYYIKRCELWKCTIISIITSLTIESIQYKIGRSFDIDDILLNVIGGLCGFLIYRMFKAIERVLPRFLKSDFVLSLISFILLLVLIAGFINYTGIWRFL